MDAQAPAGSFPVSLAELPRGHWLRVAPLFAIGAQMRWTGAPPGKGWRSIGARWRIAGNCYDDLGVAWTGNSEWRATHEPG